MKKIFLTLTALVAANYFSVAQQNSFLQKESWSYLWNHPEEQDGNNPEWYKQYYEMKHNAEGKIPRLPYAAIEKQKQNSAGLRTTPLFNIQEMGPKNYGGRTRAILLDRDNPDELFVGSVSGGLWHSTDSGAHWTVINDQLSCLSTCAITQDYYNHDVIYTGTGEGWGNGDGVIGNGVYRSTDHGVTFIQLPSTDGDEFNWIHRVEASPDDTGMLYIGTANAGLYRSFDFGDTLHKIYVTTSAINDIEITPSGGVWIAVHSQGIYFSASGDSGTFVKVTQGLPVTGDFHRIEIALAPSDTSVMYAAFENYTYDGVRGIFRSVDAGQSWTEKGNPDADFSYYMYFSWYSMCIAVKPDEPDFFFFGVGDLVYSKDGGVSYHACLNLHPDHHALAFNPGNPTRFYLGEDGGFYRLRVDQLYNNENLDEGYSTIQYYAGGFFPTGISAYGGSQDNGTHYCKDGNGDCFPILGGDGAYCAVNQQYPNIVYASYQNGAIQRADDAFLDYPTFYGTANELDANFDGTIDEGAWFINPFDINLYNGDYLGFVTLRRYWHTLDGGYSWFPAMDQLNFGNSPYAIGISKSFNPTVYVGGSSALFIRINSAFDAYPGGEADLSSKVPSAIGGDFLAGITVHPADSSMCYLAFSNYSDQPRVWKVTNGTTDDPVFTSISGDLPANLPVNYIDVDPYRPDSFFLAGTDLGLYISDDAGNHWQHIDEIPNVVVEQVRIRPSDRRIFVFTHGRGMWTATLASFESGISASAGKTINASVFPNPCTDELYVKVAEGSVRVSVRDVNNHLMIPSRLMSGNESLDVSALASGVYFMQMKKDDQILIKKIVKQ